MPVLRSAYYCRYSAIPWSPDHVETRKGYKCADSFLPAHKLEDGAGIAGEGDKEYAYYGAGPHRPCLYKYSLYSVIEI